MNLVQQAKNFATTAHGTQLRKYTLDPYINHLARVAQTMIDLGMPDEVVAAAWLHDVVEDTIVTQEDVDVVFPPVVAQLVRVATDFGPETGLNRKARKLDTIARFRLMPEYLKPFAHTLKVADGLDNADSIKEHDPKFFKVFRVEKLALLEVLTHADAGLKEKLMKVLG